MKTAPFLRTPEDTRAVRAHLEPLRTLTTGMSDRLTALLSDVLSSLAAGRAVQITSLDAEITTQQAADLLNVSRPYVVNLVEAGELPHRKVGPRRRLHLEDVLVYRARLDASRQAALQALADDLQDMGQD